MAFVLETMVDAIYGVYETLPGGREPLKRGHDGKPLFGNLDLKANADVGRVVWLFPGGSFGAATKIGGPDGMSYLAVATSQIWIWEGDLERCWNTMVDLIAAMRGTEYGVNLGPQNFTFPTEVAGRHMHFGELLVLTVNLAVPIPLVGSVPEQEVTLLEHEAPVTADNGEADDDGNFTAFDSVLVTGPPTS